MLAWPPPAAATEGFNVYRVEPPGLGQPLGAPGVVVSPPRLPENASLLFESSFVDRVEFGATRCYAVRRAIVQGGAVMESEASAPICITARDTFPPAPPRRLASVSDESGVSLIWEPNTDTDLAGYMVLRGDAPGDTLAPLTPAPIRETTYRDTTVKPGQTYVYAVVALDTAAPPNISEPSNRATEVAR
jgi:hypothetical protein